MALMTGEPRSATVKAVAEVRLAELSQEAFFELISAYPRLADEFLRQLAQRRGRTMVRQQFADLERAEIIAHLFAQPPPALDRLPGKTRWTDDTNAVIERLAAADANILIHGERGTGKDLAARLIHFRSPAQSRPLFHLDCANPPPIQRESGPGGAADQQTELMREIAQESALFGHGAAAGSYAKGVRKGYLELADSGAVVLENIDSLTPHVQQLLIRFLTEGAFVRIGEQQLLTSKTRLISTSIATLEELKGGGRLDPELLPLVGTERLQMKPLRERKKDIPVIAEHLVREYNKRFDKKVTGFSKEALNYLVDHDWPLNVDEMHQVLERAVVIADGAVITERQVFLNYSTISATGKYNLLKIPSVRELANHPFFPLGLRAVTVPFILVLILLTLFGPQRNNPVNLMVWAVMWPFLLMSILVSARSWCGYCPMPIVSDAVNTFRKRFRAMPPLLARNGLWIGIAGFALIILAEHAAHMFTTARATGVLFVTIISGTTMTNFLFGKRSWCKYFCPLGRMVANSSVISLLELGSNSNVCTSQCQTHDCIKEGNCPMGIHPSAAGVSKDCILCLSCLKRCKHQSIRLDIRFPWYEYFVKDKWNVIEAFFAVTLTAMVLAVKLPSWGPLARLWENTVINDLSLSLMTGAVFILIAFTASGLLSGGGWKKNFAVAGSAYLFLAFAGFFNIYFHELVYNGHNFFPWIVEIVGLGSRIPVAWITLELGTLKAVIPLITLVGAIASYVLLTRLSGKYALSPVVRHAHQVVIIITTLVFLVIL